MVPLSAEILTEQVSGDGRAAVRRSLRLGVQAHSDGEVAMALILNLSATGLLLETVITLEIGEVFRVDIPEANGTTARVVWTDGFLAGCEFLNAVSTAAVSASQLKAPRAFASQSPAPDTDRQIAHAGGDREEATAQWAIVMISALISLVALIVFLAAIELL